jgi:hypothetical protein
LLGLYDGYWHSEAEIKQIVLRWSAALAAIADSFDDFQADAIKMGDYLDAQE